MSWRRGLAGFMRDLAAAAAAAALDVLETAS